MKRYTRPPSKFNNPYGTHVVYDSKEEALADNISDVVHILDKKEKSHERILRVGRWLEYNDGRVAQILKLKETNKQWYCYTILNCFHMGKGKKYIMSDFEYEYSPYKKKINLGELTPAKVKFAEDWLFHGYTLEESSRKHLRYYYHYERKRLFGKQPGKTNSGFTMKLFAYIVLNGKWFDKLLELSRPIRDRYMNLVQAFQREGINDDFIAKRLKEFADGDGKNALDALKTILTIMQREKDKRPSVPAEFLGEIEGKKEPKRLEPRNGSMTVDDFIENQQREVHTMELDTKQVGIKRLEEILHELQNTKAGDTK